MASVGRLWWWSQLQPLHESHPRGTGETSQAMQRSLHSWKTMNVLKPQPASIPFIKWFGARFWLYPNFCHLTDNRYFLNAPCGLSVLPLTIWKGCFWKLTFTSVFRDCKEKYSLVCQLARTLAIYAPPVLFQGSCANTRIRVNTHMHAHAQTHMHAPAKIKERTEEVGIGEKLAVIYTWRKLHA